MVRTAWPPRYTRCHPHQGCLLRLARQVVEVEDPRRYTEVHIWQSAWMSSLFVIEGYSVSPIESHPHRPPTGSVEWLLDALERHAIAEQDALAQSEYLRTASDDPVIALVMLLILDDEERHYGLLKRVEATLHDALEWTHSPAALPAPAPPRQPVKARADSGARAFFLDQSGRGVNELCWCPSRQGCDCRFAGRGDRDDDHGQR